MKYPGIVTTALLVNVILGVCFSYFFWADRGDGQGSIGLELKAYGTGFWFGSMVVFAVLGLLKKGWAVILSALFTMSYFGFLILTGFVRFPAKEPLVIATIVILTLPIVLNVLAVFYYREHNKEISAE